MLGPRGPASQIRWPDWLGRIKSPCYGPIVPTEAERGGPNEPASPTVRDDGRVATLASNCDRRFLIVYSIASVYGRLNVDFGSKIFSKVPKEEIRTNTAHIVRYTVGPVIAMIGYVALLLMR